MIRLDVITMRFGGVTALDAISASFAAPVSGIIGPNGAGKTTTMNVISGFLTPTSGRILVGDTDLLALPPHRRPRWGLRRSFQREEIAEDLSVQDNIRAVLDNLLPEARDLQAALEFADLTGIRHKPGAALNTFERRLTDLARCRAGRPKLIMLDEPAGGLTVQETEVLGGLILRLAAETGAQVLVIDHDVDLIQRICAETLVLDFGRRIAFGTTSEVLADPAVKAAYLGMEDA